MSPYKLIYFPYRARAEPLRYLLAFSGEKFEDVRISRDEWPNMKPKMPMGQMPVLELDGKLLAQSATIGRFLAKKFRLMPETDWEAARTEMMVDGVLDLHPHIRQVQMAIYAKDENRKKEAWENFKTEQLPGFLNRYENFLRQNGTGFLVGNQLTMADIYLAEMLNRLTTIYDKPEILSNHGNLVALMNKVHEIPNIKKYVDNRPQTIY